MKTQLDIDLILGLMIWRSEPRNALDIVRSYCPFINNSEIASQITEMAIDIDNAYQHGASALELDPKMLLLKQVATGIELEEAMLFGLVPDYSETLALIPHFRNRTKVETLPNLPQETGLKHE